MLGYIEWIQTVAFVISGIEDLRYSIPEITYFDKSRKGKNIYSDIGSGVEGRCNILAGGKVSRKNNFVVRGITHVTLYQVK